MQFVTIKRSLVLLVLAAFAACAPPQTADQSHSASVSQASASPEAPSTTSALGPEATPTPTNVATATALPTTPATVTPTPISSSGGAATTAPIASAAPSVLPSASSTPDVSAAPDAAPQIVAIKMNATTVHAGDTVTGTVETSSNVASVEVRIASFSITMPKVDVGRFALSYTVPHVPFFLHGTYPMQVIARNARGASATQTVPISVR